MITAHGGALGTGRNSKAYFEAIERGEIVSDAIEVDVRGCRGNLYISHSPTLNSGGKIPLTYVIEFAKKHKLTVNFDIKSSRLFVPVRDLVVEMGAEEFLLYTGSVKPRHIKYLTAGQVYANRSFFGRRKFCAQTVKNIKDYLDSFGNDRLKGINVSYKKFDKAFFDECARVGLKVSLYTVDDEDALKTYLPMGLDNITTNRPDLVAKIKGESNG